MSLAGMTDAFVWDAGTPNERVTGPAETQQLLDEIDAKFRRECAHFIYHHQVIQAMAGGGPCALQREQGAEVCVPQCVGLRMGQPPHPGLNANLPNMAPGRGA